MPINIIPTSSTAGHSYVEWSAVIAGAVIATAISIILLQFGNALGLSILVNLNESDTQKARWAIFIVGLWLFWVQLIASMSGAYIAGRMRSPIAEFNEHESEVRDGTHGLLVWATSTAIAAASVAFATLVAAVVSSHTIVENPHDHVQNVNGLIRNANIVFGFVTVASAFVSAVASWFIATLAGEHRDKAVDLSHHISFRKRK